METTPTLILGIPTSIDWSICTEFSSRQGSLHVALTVHSKQGEAAVVGRGLIHTLQEWYERQESFDQSVRFFASFQIPDSCEIVVWYERDNQSLFCACRGSAGVVRQGKYFPILSSLEDLSCVQGSLNPGDTLLFGTLAFHSILLPQLLHSSMDVVIAAQRIAATEQYHANPNVCGEVFPITPISDSIVPSHEKPPVPVLQPNPKQSLNTRQTLPASANTLWLHFSPRLRRVTLLLLFIIVIVGGVFSLQRFSLGSRSRRIDAVIVPLQNRLQQVSESSQTRLEKEKILAELLSDSKQAKENNKADPAISTRLENITEQIQTRYMDVAKRKTIDHLAVFYDFRLITADFVGTQIQYDFPGKLAVFLDISRGKLVSLSIEKKQPQSLSVNADIGNLLSLSIVDRKAYLLGTKGIYETSLPLDTEGKIVVSSSDSWQQPKLIGSFAKNLYVFDTGARQIFRYDRDDPTASPSSWLRGKEGVDPDSINSLAIDGDLYTGTNTGEIYKFSRGDRARFAYNDMLNPPTTAVTIYTSQETEHLYVLEPRSQRIIILDKTGTYVSSLFSPDLAAATALIVDESEKKAYVLAGSLVYEVEL